MASWKNLSDFAAKKPAADVDCVHMVMYNARVRRSSVCIVEL